MAWRLICNVLISEATPTTAAAEKLQTWGTREAFFSSRLQPEFLKYELDFPAVFPVVRSHCLGGCGFCHFSTFLGKSVVLAKKGSTFGITAPSPHPLLIFLWWCCPWTLPSHQVGVVKTGLNSGPTQPDSLPSGLLLILASSLKYLYHLMEIPL